MLADTGLVSLAAKEVGMTRMSAYRLRRAPYAAAFARAWDVALVSVEAKGPHCIFPGHSTGEVIRLGDPFEELRGLEADE